MSQMRKLFEPISIGDMEVRNRIVMPSLGLVYTPRYLVNDRLKNFYLERAEGGVGLVILNVSRVEFQGRGVTLAIYDDKFIPSLRELTDLLHSRGAKVVAQLTARPLWVKREGEPADFVGPSDIIISRRPGVPRPRPLTTEEIEEIVERLGEETRRAREAGFDAVEIAAMVGTSLLSQFISPFTNKRTDRYGGSLENRYRFLLEVIAGAKKRAGQDYPLICRLSGADFMEGGFDLEDTKLAAPLLEQAGVSSLDVTTGWHEAPVAFFQRGVPPGAYIYLAEAVKRAVHIPVMGGTKIANPLLADRLLAEGKIDLVFMGRALIADPEFPRKAMEGRLEDIRHWPKSWNR